MKRAILVVACVLSLAACSSKGTVIPQDPAKWNQLKDATKQLSDTDRRLFAIYMARVSVAGALAGGKPNIPAGMTIGQAIEDQKKFEADQAKSETDAAILRAKVAAQRAAAEAALNRVALITLVSKTYVPKDIYRERFNDNLAMVLAIKNNSAKDIAGIKGTLRFEDMFGAEIKTVSLSFDGGVKAGQTVSTSDYSLELNQFEQSDTQVAQTDLAKMKVTFHPEMIVFADGSKMAPQSGTVATP